MCLRVEMLDEHLTESAPPPGRRDELVEGFAAEKQIVSD